MSNKSYRDTHCFAYKICTYSCHRTRARAITFLPEEGHICTTGPLYLSCVSNPSSQVWYKQQPMRVNKLNDMMKVIIKGTPLEDSWKTFSNHSARKTVVRKLKTAGLERSPIVKVTGHRNEKSLDDYDEGDENEQRQLFHTISYSTNINS